MQERRENKRIAVNGVYGNMFCTFDNVDILNIGLGGAAIRLNRNLIVDREYSIRIEGRDRQVEFRGTVVWCDLKEHQVGHQNNVLSVYHAGIKFNDIFTNKATVLIDFIESHKRRENKERLRGMRVIIDLPGKVILCDQLGYKVKRMSHFGMLIETAQPFNPEDRLPMELFLKDISPFRINSHGMQKSRLPVEKFFEDDRIIKFSGKIVSCEEIKSSDPMYYDVGVEFMEMHAQAWANLDAFIRSM